MARHSEERLGDVLEQVVEVARNRFEHLPPATTVDAERLLSLIEGTKHGTRGRVVERMRAFDLGTLPGQTG